MPGGSGLLRFFLVYPVLLCSAPLRPGQVWSGLFWSGLVSSGLVWCSLVWLGQVWSALGLAAVLAEMGGPVLRCFHLRSRGPPRAGPDSRCLGPAAARAVGFGPRVRRVLASRCRSMLAECAAARRMPRTLRGCGGLSLLPARHAQLPARGGPIVRPDGALRRRAAGGKTCQRLGGKGEGGALPPPSSSSLFLLLPTSDCLDSLRRAAKFPS